MRSHRNRQWPAAESTRDRGDFTLGEMTDAHASIYLYGRDVTKDEAQTYGNYYGVLFHFKLEGSAVLSVLWSKKNGNWRLVSDKAFNSKRNGQF
jgi:hypothetical protein